MRFPLTSHQDSEQSFHQSCKRFLWSTITHRHSPGCFCDGTQEFKMVRAPFIRPEPPIPATARPTINIFEDVATPQSKEPSSKIKRQTRKDHCKMMSNSHTQGVCSAIHLGVEARIDLARQRLQRGAESHCKQPSNVYEHTLLDRWMEGDVRCQLEGTCIPSNVDE